MNYGFSIESLATLRSGPMTMIKMKLAMAKKKKKRNNIVETDSQQTAMAAATDNKTKGKENQ